VDDSEFRLRADQALDDLNNRCATASNSYALDADMNGGALVIEFEDPPAKFVVSPNAPVHQIWVSALLRSFKLDWDPARKEFVAPQTGESLVALLASLASQHLGEKVTL
jgi:iron donor protein CyaY